MTLTLPKIIGHRGAMARAPENTLAGFRKARELGATMIEFDAKLSRDGVPVLIHDETVDRTTDGSGAVRDMDVDELRALDAGGWFGPEFAGERIPTLEEGLRLALEIGLAVNIEIKPCPGREIETARIVLETARALWPADKPAPLISSFALASLEQSTLSAPDWPRGYLIWDRPDDWRENVRRLTPATLNVGHERETPESLADYIDTGLPVLAYTVNDPARARVLLDLGVSSIITDVPDLILPII
ncbi:glycerophosphodiester phosphodiesterase [Inquilinus sp. CAU 1745]|uniref:glycerophosphodiester phosphodiesterase n=1 Tax=Inquilinus sp. CAU 1745 TaxID=3140369 RepID=UPI00325B6329